LWTSRLSEGLVHDPPDGTGATPAFGAASQAPVDLAGRPDRALRRNGPDLMVRNDVARTHDHEGTPGPIRYLMIRARLRTRCSGWRPILAISRRCPASAM